MGKKDKCCECGKETTNHVNILTGEGWKYEVYCLQCARVFFSHIGNNNTKEMTIKQLNGLSYQWDDIVNQNAIKMRADNVDWTQLPSKMKQIQKEKAEGMIKTSLNGGKDE